MTISKTSKLTFPGFEATPLQAQYRLAVVIRGGEFRSADFVVPIPEGSVKISGGIADGEFVAFPDGSHGLYGKPLVVPGGVTGVGALSRAMGSMGNVTARVQAIKPMVIHDLLAFEISVFLCVHVRSPFVGGECYIGTPDEPVAVRLRRMEWDRYIPTLMRDGVPDHVIAVADIHVAASKFRVPAVSGAGPMGAFNAFVNARAGLPNPGVSTFLKVQAEAFLARNPDYSGTD